MNGRKYVLFSFLILILYSFIFFDSSSGVLLISIVLSFILIYLYVKECTIFKITYLVAFYNYFILSIVIFFTELFPSYLTNEYFLDYYYSSLFIESIFWISIGYFIDNKIPYKNFFINIENTLAIYIISTFLLLIELALNFERLYLPYLEDTNIGTPIYEIASILIALLIIGRQEFKLKKLSYAYIEFICVLLIFIIGVGSGKRLGISFVLIAYLTHIGSKKALFFTYSVITFLGYLHGFLRDSYSSGRISIESLISNLFFTNQGGSLHAASVYLRLIDEGLLTFQDRIIALASTFLGAIFFPISFLPEVTQLNLFAMNYYPIQGNGGLIGVYSFIFFGIFGPVILPFFISRILTRNSTFFKIVSALIVITSIRWTLYNLAPAIKIISYTLFIYYFLLLFSSKKNYSIKL